ncbi:hypothetical protein J6590_034834 [Homalodisca vitripennis]|nr:hypothetical protein J6590_034834 [Homalodisca vitripennis]
MFTSTLSPPISGSDGFIVWSVPFSNLAPSFDCQVLTQHRVSRRPLGSRVTPREKKPGESVNSLAVEQAPHPGFEDRVGRRAIAVGLTTSAEPIDYLHFGCAGAYKSRDHAFIAGNIMPCKSKSAMPSRLNAVASASSVWFAAALLTMPPCRATLTGLQIAVD